MSNIEGVSKERWSWCRGSKQASKQAGSVALARCSTQVFLLLRSGRSAVDMLHFRKTVASIMTGEVLFVTLRLRLYGARPRSGEGISGFIDVEEGDSGDSGREGALVRSLLLGKQG
jgi:hypothetical protein